MSNSYDLANILLAGPCNQRCPDCIGRQINPLLNRNNLDEFPLRGLEAFVSLIQRHGVRQIVLSGTTSDPQLYRHEARLIRWLRGRVPGAQISLHTNGQLALSRMAVFNMYDRATLSFPSFDPDTFARMTGVRRMPDLKAIVREARIPLKVSCLIGPHNVAQVDEFLARCREIGLRRVVLRQRYGDARQWRVLSHLAPVAFYRSNPVYDWRGLEVTCWRFEQTTCTALNLFSDGSISREYLLARPFLSAPRRLQLPVAAPAAGD